MRLVVGENGVVVGVFGRGALCVLRRIDRFLPVHTVAAVAQTCGNGCGDGIGAEGGGVVVVEQRRIALVGRIEFGNKIGIGRSRGALIDRFLARNALLTLFDIALGAGNLGV